TRIGEIDSSRTHLIAERDDVRHALETLNNNYSAMAQRETSRRSRTAELRAKITELNGKITESTAEAEAAASRAKTLRQVVASSMDDVSRLEERIRSMTSLESEAASRAREVSRNAGDTLLRVEEERRKAEEAELHIDQAQAAIHEAEKLLAEADAAKETALLVQSRNLLLARTQRLIDGGSIQGVEGTLSNFLEVSPELRPAVESACSGWLQAVLLDDQAAGERLARLLSYLGSTGRTIATASSSSKASRRRDRSIESSSLLDNIAVHGKDAWKAAEDILGDVYLVETSAEGSKVAEKGYRAVSRQG
ncbi:MAG: hypothetical protein GTN93_22935, partial [Anaerolineae bacterium]|nr:hypothetical protein [Anaerolineae bacterium]